MIDNVQFNEKDKFYPYISKAMNLDCDAITNLDQLYDVFSETKENTEVIIHDLSNVSDENKKFALDVTRTLKDADNFNRNLTLKFMEK